MRPVLLVLSLMLIIIVSGCSGESADWKEQDTLQQVDEIGSGQNKPTKSVAENAIYGPSHPGYEMELNYNSKKHEISGSMSVQFTNNLDRTLNEVYFNLWPKADDFEDGDISVSNVRYNRSKSDFDIDQNHLRVSGISLVKNERAKISMTFTVKIPKQQHRFGWDGESVSLGNWFPILAVFDNNGWNLYPYFEEGESFYSLIGDYDVTLITDNNVVVAATGTQTMRMKKENEQVMYHFKAQNVRDFAIQMDPNYHVTTEVVDDTKLNVYYTEEQEKAGYKKYLIDSGRQSLEIFNKKIGSYAWDELTIVGMDCGFGGMEYPQLVMVCANEQYNEDDIRSIVAHEIGHQWFYSAVGNNQFKEPWLDEAFASFMEELATDGLQYLNNNEFRKPKNPYRLDSPVSTFMQHGDQGNDAYWEYIYNYGLKTLNDLRIELGDDVFYKAMGQYYNEMKFKVATTSDFIRIMEDTTGKDLTKFFKNHYIEVDK